MKYWIVIYLVPERVYLAVHCRSVAVASVGGRPACPGHSRAGVSTCCCSRSSYAASGDTEAAHGFSVTGLERGVSVLLADAGLGVVEWRAGRRKLHASKRRMTHPGRFHDFKKEVR